MLSLFIANILGWIWAHKTFSLIAALVLLSAITVGILTHRANDAEKQAREAQIEANRAKDKAAGLEILINSNSTAKEIEKERQKANEQENNSNLANADFNNSIIRDSGTFSGNYAETRKRFCKSFPRDERCR